MNQQMVCALWSGGDGVKRMSRPEQRARVGVSGRERTGRLSQRWSIKTADSEGKNHRSKSLEQRDTYR